MFQEAASEDNVKSWARALGNVWRLTKEFDQKHALFAQEATHQFADANEVAKMLQACSDCLHLEEEALRTFKSTKCPDPRLKDVHEAARHWLEDYLDLNKACSSFQSATLAFVKRDKANANDIMKRLRDVIKANEKTNRFSSRIAAADLIFGALLYSIKQLHADLFCVIAPDLQSLVGFTCVLPNGSRIVFPFV